MKIAILYMCTGNYVNFFKSFFSSCEHNFIRNAEKHYFVFTDGNVSGFDDDRVHKINQVHLGWPDGTLKRFHFFYDISDHLSAFDYIFFFNANCEFKKEIEEVFLPSEQEGLAVVQHPGFYKAKKDVFPYERNKKSNAYISFKDGLYYIFGAVNGGTSAAYLKLIHDLRNAIDEDLEKGIRATWLDESHLNKYIISRPYKLLTPSYAYPEGWELPFEKIIEIRDKSKAGGHDYFRNAYDKSQGHSFKKNVNFKVLLEKYFQFIKLFHK